MEAAEKARSELASIWFGKQNEKESNCYEMHSVLLVKHFMASINPCVQYIQREFSGSFSGKQKVTLETFQQKSPKV